MGKPSDGDFSADIHGLMLTIVQFLASTGMPFVANVYPFISLSTDPNFLLDYAFFQCSRRRWSTAASPIAEHLRGNHDKLVTALPRNGFRNVSVIVGELGWPTDGDANANLDYAQRFNQDFLDCAHHLRPGHAVVLGPVDAYLFSLIDEDR
jgi:hypothetical protein